MRSEHVQDWLPLQFPPLAKRRTITQMCCTSQRPSGWPQRAVTRSGSWLGDARYSPPAVFTAAPHAPEDSRMDRASP